MKMVARVQLLTRLLQVEMVDRAVEKGRTTEEVLAVALGFLGVCAIVFGSDSLGPGGAALCIIIAVGCYLFYRTKERESSADFERVRTIDRIVKEERELRAHRP